MESGTILYSTFSAEALERLVLPHYDLGESVECEILYRGLNDTYRVSTTDHRFALRLYKARWRTRMAAIDELAALRHLAARGVPVAAPVARTDGEWVTDVDAPEGPRSAALFHWIDGEEPKYRIAEHAQLYGSLAARLHIAGDDFPSCTGRVPLDINYLLEGPLTTFRPALKSSPLLAARLEALAERVRTRLDRARDQLWDWGFCHGDLHGGNARIHGEQLALFDFDCCGHGWRLYDLATYRWAARLRNIEQMAWNPFIEAYLRIRPAAADMLEHVPLFVILRHIWLQGFAVWNSTENGSYFVTDEYFGGWIEFCEKIESEYFNP